MRTTIRISYVRGADRYRIDEVAGDGVVRTEISPAWLCDEAFAKHLAGLVAGYRGGLEVSRGAIDEDAVVLECGRSAAGVVPRSRVGRAAADRIVSAVRACHACLGMCRRQVPSGHFTCRWCWYRLPPALRDLINATHGRDPSAHAEAMLAAIAFYREEQLP